jgi:hypothetical protein
MLSADNVLSTNIMYSSDNIILSDDNMMFADKIL